MLKTAELGKQSPDHLEPSFCHDVYKNSIRTVPRISIFLSIMNQITASFFSLPILIASSNFSAFSYPITSEIRKKNSSSRAPKATGAYSTTIVALFLIFSLFYPFWLFIFHIINICYEPMQGMQFLHCLISLLGQYSS